MKVVKINSPISNFDLRKPLIVELGTSLENVLSICKEQIIIVS